MYLTLQKKKNKKINQNIDYSLPYWSPKAPDILKNLDFTKIDGSKENYTVGTNYNLSLISRQGGWGRTYILRKTEANFKSNIICAVKLILTRTDKNLDISKFRARHKTEIENNIKIANYKLGIAADTYGLKKINDDLYLLFMEYGENLHSKINDNSIEPHIEQFYNFLKSVDKFHNLGYAHGDLKLDNMLLINNKIKLIDWFSFIELKKHLVGEYRYIGDELPPEAIRALYYREKNKLEYAPVSINGNKKAQNLLYLHPIVADRFCLGMSLLEVIYPQFYREYHQQFPDNFNPWRPKSLDFWSGQVKYLQNLQLKLRLLAQKVPNKKKRYLILKIANFIDVYPTKRLLS